MESHSSSPGRRARALLRRWAQDFGLELITAIESGGAPRAGFLIDAIELLAEEVNRRWPAFGIVELDDDVRVRAMILLWGWLESASAVVEATAEYLAAHPDGPHAGASELIAFVDAIAYDYLTAADEDLAWAWMLTDLPPTVDELCRDRRTRSSRRGSAGQPWMTRWSSDGGLGWRVRRLVAARASLATSTLRRRGGQIGEPCPDSSGVGNAPWAQAQPLGSQLGDPPLIAGTVHGVRTWMVHMTGAGELRLRAPTLCAVWTPGVMRAGCRKHPVGAPNQQPPVASCGCGLYAVHPHAPQAVRRLVRGLRHGMVAGVVEAWGRIEVSFAGLRAQYARPVVLFSDRSVCGSVPIYLGELASIYGAEVVEVDGPEGLTAHLRGLNGIPEGTLRELLGDPRQIALVPTRPRRRWARCEQVVESGFRAELLRHDVVNERVPLRPPRDGVELAVEPADGTEPVLQTRAFGLLREVTLAAEGDRVAVWDRRGRVRGGYVTANQRAARAMLRSGTLARAVVVRQTRARASGERRSIAILATEVLVELGSSRIRVALDPDDPPI